MSLKESIRAPQHPTAADSYIYFKIIVRRKLIFLSSHLPTLTTRATNDCNYNALFASFWWPSQIFLGLANWFVYKLVVAIFMHPSF